MFQTTVEGLPKAPRERALPRAAKDYHRLRTMSQRPLSSSFPRWAFALLLLGAVVYFGLFYSTHQFLLDNLGILLIPDDLLQIWMGGGGSRFGLLDRWPIILLAAVILLSAYAAGRLSLSWLKCESKLTRLESVVFSLGVGLSELSLATLALGLVGLLHQAWLFQALLAAILVLFAWRWCNGKLAFVLDENTQAEMPRGELSRLERLLPWATLPFLLLLVLGGMIPPWEFDVREYHLQVPKEWYLDGQISFLPHNVYGNMPLGAELHSLLAMAITPGQDAWWWGALAGKLIIALAAPLTALTLFAAARRLFGQQAGIVAAAIYLSIPWVIYISVTGLVECFVALYFLQAFYATWLAVQAGEKEANRKQILAGFLAGSAVACKYPALLFVVVPLAVWTLFARKRLDWRAATVFSIAAFCSCGLWFAKNAWQTVNPIYPLVFGGETRTTERMEQWNRAHRVPVNETGERFSAAQAKESLQKIGWQNEMLSPIVMPFAVFALAFYARTKTNERDHKTLVRVLVGLIIFMTLAWWLVTHRIERFLVPILPVAVLLASAASTWESKDELLAKLWNKTVPAVLLVGMLSNFICILVPPGAYAIYPGFLTGLEHLRDGESLTKDIGPRVKPIHRYLNKNVPKDGKVLLVGDAEVFDLEVPILYNTCFDECIFEQIFKGRTRDERLAVLRERNISHVYISWSEIGRYRGSANYGFTDYVSTTLVNEELVKDQKLLRLVEASVDSETDEVFWEVFEVRYE